MSIAIDTMGGDYGEKPIIEGLVQALREKPFNAVLVGKHTLLEPQIPQDLREFVSYEEASDVFRMEESATDALKHKESTIYKAIELVRDKKVQAIVSAGHSGATMSLATLRIGRINNVLRPAIATLMPSVTGKTLVLDVGANTDCKSEYLFQFAIMGEAYAKEVMKIAKPRVALLSNGEEESKGNELTKEAHALLKKMPNFIGNGEGRDIFNGEVDVLVCDGFSGNLVLKATEGAVTAVFDLLKKHIKSSFVAMLGVLFLKPVFRKLKKHIDWQEYGGAPLLGINGCVIISHGKSDGRAIKNAIFQALNFSESKINQIIESELAAFAK